MNIISTLFYFKFKDYSDIRIIGYLIKNIYIRKRIWYIFRV